MTNLEELAQKARTLSPEDRARLAEELLESRHEGRDPEVEAAWEAEVRCRIAQIESGNAKLVPAEEVFAEIRQLPK